MDDVAYAQKRTRKTGYQQLIVNPRDKKYFEKRNDFFRSQRFRFACLRGIIRAPRMLMITTTTIIATTIIVMAQRPFALMVTMRIPLIHALRMDIGDQITSLASSR